MGKILMVFLMLAANSAFAGRFDCQGQNETSTSNGDELRIVNVDGELINARTLINTKIEVSYFNDKTPSTGLVKNHRGDRVTASGAVKAHNKFVIGKVDFLVPANALAKKGSFNAQVDIKEKKQPIVLLLCKWTSRN